MAGFLDKLKLDTSKYPKGVIEYQLVGSPIAKQVAISKFAQNTLYGEGDIQRHILSHHQEFVDHWRICGDFLCLELEPKLIRPSTHNIDKGIVQEYAKLSSSPPPIVLDFDGDFIDGGHRHAAALLKESPKILTLVQITDGQYEG